MYSINLQNYYSIYLSLVVGLLEHMQAVTCRETLVGVNRSCALYPLPYRSILVQDMGSIAFSVPLPGTRENSRDGFLAFRLRVSYGLKDRSNLGI